MVPGAAGSARGRRLLRLLRTDRLRKRFEFGRVRDQGRRVHTKSFVLVLCKSEHEHSRLGLTVSSKVGCAVRRNRVKRLLREVFRQRRELFPQGVDVVVIAKTGSTVDDYREVERELTQASAAMRAALGRAPTRSQPPRSPSSAPVRSPRQAP